MTNYLHLRRSWVLGKSIVESVLTVICLHHSSALCSQSVCLLFFLLALCLTFLMKTICPKWPSAVTATDYIILVPWVTVEERFDCTCSSKLF
jgi:hypothetical protein